MDKWKRSLGILTISLVFMTAFASSYVGAMHEPSPHSVPVGVVGQNTTVATAVASQLDALSGDPFSARTYANIQDGRKAIEDHKVYAVYDATDNKLYVASAAGRSASLIIQGAFSRVAQAENRSPATVVDVKPLPKSDAYGTSTFYVAIAWIFGGYFTAVLIGLIGDKLTSDRRRAVNHLVLLAVFSVLGSAVTLAVMKNVFHVLGGATLPSLLIGALTIFAAGTTTAALQRVAGMAGTGIAILLLVFFGNAASGGAYARGLLPEPWRTLGGLLPPGAAVDALRSVVFFDGAQVGTPLVVLGVWAAAGVLVTLVAGARKTVASDAEVEVEVSGAAAGA